MGQRFKKAVQALAVVLMITVACLAFMPWRMSDVVEPLEDITQCMVLRYDRSYSIAHPAGGQLEQLVETLGDSTGTFDRARSALSYSGEEPLYRIYLWTSEGRISDIWTCGPAFFYDGAQFMLNDDDAAALGNVLASCFS